MTTQNTNNEKRIVKEKYVIHSLKEISRLIKENLSGIKHNWQLIGEYLLEARFQFEEEGKNDRQVASDFWEWVEHQRFTFSRKTAEYNMSAASKYLKLKPRERKISPTTVHGILRPDYKMPDQEIREKIKKTVESARRFATAMKERRDEEEVIRNLALKIIDVGYKVLSVKFHPDKKDGSADMMRRLNAAKAMLKERI